MRCKTIIKQSQVFCTDHVSVRTQLMKFEQLTNTPVDWLVSFFNFNIDNIYVFCKVRSSWHSFIFILKKMLYYSILYYTVLSLKYCQEIFDHNKRWRHVWIRFWIMVVFWVWPPMGPNRTGCVARFYINTFLGPHK